MSEPLKSKLESPDIPAGQRDELKRALGQAFPSIFSAGSIDFDQLRRALGDWVDPSRERFGLNWPGKAECTKIIQQRSVATLKPDRRSSIDFDTTSNLFIEGDNLEVLRILQKSYFTSVKMIYIDPPYNTGNEFIYPDKFSENLQTYLAYTGQSDGGGIKFSTNAESAGRYHSRWLSMMYPRLYLSRNLLRDDGAIFISIGQDELSNLIQICSEIFGEDNLVSICSRVMKTGGQKGAHFSPSVDYVLIYAKNINELAPFREQISQNVIDKVYTKVETTGEKAGKNYRSMGLYQAMLDKRANQRFYIECPDGSFAIPPGNSFPPESEEGSQVTPNDEDGVWRWTYPRFKSEKADGNIEYVKSDRSSLVQPDGTPSKWNIYYKIWLEDRLEDGQLPGNIIDKFESRHSSSELKSLDIPFDFAKPSALIKYFMSLCCVKDGDIVLDFFAGSASTAHAAMQLSAETGLSHPFVCVQLPEETGQESEERKAGYATISDIAMERVRRVAKKLSEGNLVGKPDTGMRVFRLTQSNFAVWEQEAAGFEASGEQLDMHVEHVSSESSSEDILYEILLKSGFPPTTRVTTTILAEKEVFSVEEGLLLICLDKELSSELIDALADAAPLQVICLDQGFRGNDQLKANAVQTFKARAQAEESEIVFRTV